MPHDAGELKALAVELVRSAQRLADAVVPYDEAGERILRMRLREMTADLGHMAAAFEQMGKASSEEGVA